jgi:hypothetical protein
MKATYGPTHVELTFSVLSSILLVDIEHDEEARSHALWAYTDLRECSVVLSESWNIPVGPTQNSYIHGNIYINARDCRML